MRRMAWIWSRTICRVRGLPAAVARGTSNRPSMGESLLTQGVSFNHESHESARIRGQEACSWTARRTADEADGTGMRGRSLRVGGGLPADPTAVSPTWPGRSPPCRVRGLPAAVARGMLNRRQFSTLARRLESSPPRAAGTGWRLSGFSSCRRDGVAQAPDPTGRSLPPCGVRGAGDVELAGGRRRAGPRRLWAGGRRASFLLPLASGGTLGMLRASCLNPRRSAWTYGSFCCWPSAPD
jgi:hypothetical protein